MEFSNLSLRSVEIDIFDSCVVQARKLKSFMLMVSTMNSQYWKSGLVLLLIVFALIIIKQCASPNRPGHQNKSAKHLIGTIRKARRAYYNAKPIMSDAEYDDLVERPAEIEIANGLAPRLRTTMKHHKRSHSSDSKSSKRNTKKAKRDSKASGAMLASPDESDHAALQGHAHSDSANMPSSEHVQKRGNMIQSRASGSHDDQKTYTELIRAIKNGEDLSKVLSGLEDDNFLKDAKQLYEEYQEMKHDGNAIGSLSDEDARELNKKVTSDLNAGHYGGKDSYMHRDLSHRLKLAMMHPKFGNQHQDMQDQDQIAKSVLNSSNASSRDQNMLKLAVADALRKRGKHQAANLVEMEVDFLPGSQNVAQNIYNHSDLASSTVRHSRGPISSLEARYPGGDVDMLRDVLDGDESYLPAHPTSDSIGDSCTYTNQAYVKARGVTRH